MHQIYTRSSATTDIAHVIRHKTKQLQKLDSLGYISDANSTGQVAANLI